MASDMNLTDHNHGLDYFYLLTYRGDRDISCPKEQFRDSKFLTPVSMRTKFGLKLR